MPSLCSPRDCVSGLSIGFNSTPLSYCTYCAPVSHGTVVWYWHFLKGCCDRRTLHHYSEHSVVPTVPTDLPTVPTVPTVPVSHTVVYSTDIEKGCCNRRTLHQCSKYSIAFASLSTVVNLCALVVVVVGSTFSFCSGGWYIYNIYITYIIYIYVYLARSVECYCILERGQT